LIQKRRGAKRTASRREKKKKKKKRKGEIPPLSPRKRVGREKKGEKSPVRRPNNEQGRR